MTGPAAETPDLQGAYPRLDDAQIATLTGLGPRRPTQPGETLFRGGDRYCDFFVILAGYVAVQEGRGTPEERIISLHGRGRFPGDLILRACLVRRSLLISLGVGLRIVGSRYSPDVRRLRDFAPRNRLPYRWLDLEADPAAEALLGQLGVDPADTPVVIAASRLLRNPSTAELAAAIGLPVPHHRGRQLRPPGRRGRARWPVRRGLPGFRRHGHGRHRRHRDRGPGRDLVTDRGQPCAQRLGQAGGRGGRRGSDGHPAGAGTVAERVTGSEGSGACQ